MIREIDPSIFEYYAVINFHYEIESSIFEYKIDIFVFES